MNQLKALQAQHKHDIKRLEEMCEERLCNIFLHESLPLDIIGTGKLGSPEERIIPANRRVTKVLIRKVVAAHKRIDIDPSPVRIKLMEILLWYETKLEELEATHKSQLVRLQSS